MWTNGGLMLVLAALMVGCGNIEEVPMADLRGSGDALATGAGGAIASPDAGAGGAAGALVSGTGGAIAGTGGMTGTGGMGTGGSPVLTCDDLLACCGSMPAGPLKTQCLSAYGGATSGNLGTCGSVLVMIRAGGGC